MSILRAMRDELDRSRQLRVVGGGDDVPYFISYSLTDAERFQRFGVDGRGGGAGARTVSGRRMIEVRVGSYDFDHTGHIYSGIYTGSRYDRRVAARRQLSRRCGRRFWLATDRAYKTALESMARKRAALNSANAPGGKAGRFLARRSR